MILPSDETELSTKNQGVGLSTKKQSDDTTSLKTESNTAKEEGIGSVSGPAVSMIANNNYKEEEAMTMPSESKSNEEGGNPNHDASNGQFTSGSGGSSDNDSDKPKKVNNAQKEHDDNMKAYEEETKEWNETNDKIKERNTLRKKLKKSREDENPSWKAVDEKLLFKVWDKSSSQNGTYLDVDMNSNDFYNKMSKLTGSGSDFTRILMRRGVIEDQTFKSFNGKYYYRLTDKGKKAYGDIGWKMANFKASDKPVKPIKRRGDASQSSIKSIISGVKKNDEEGAFNKL